MKPEILLKKIFSNKTVRALLIIVIIAVVTYYIFEPKIMISPITEAERMERLEKTKQSVELSKFESDGCSGHVSSSWSSIIKRVSRISKTFAEKYSDLETVPFESFCVNHDRSYHEGDHLGKTGYVGRLKADNKLRSEIINYGIRNAEDIKNRSGLKTQEEAILIYEIIAETIYRGVRLGGGPCSGESYAWGFGYNNGVCVK